MKVIITDVKIVGLCLKHRGNEPAPRNKYGELWDEKDIACISCAIVGYDGADETVADISEHTTVRGSNSEVKAPLRRQEHDMKNVIISRLKALETWKVNPWSEKEHVEWDKIQEIIDEFEVKEV